MNLRDQPFRDDFHSLLGGPRERRRVMREIRQLEAEELRRLHAGTSDATSQGGGNPYGLGDDSSAYDATYLTQPRDLQGFEGGMGGGRGSSAGASGEMLYGRPVSAYTRGTSPSLLLTTMEDELDPSKQHEKMLTQRAHATTLSVPRVPPTRVFTNFMKAPSAMRKRGLRSPDVLFEPGLDDNGVFWLYDRHRVSQSTLGSAVGSTTYSGGGAGGKGGAGSSSAAQSAMDEATFVKLPVWASIRRKLTHMIQQGAQQERFGIVFDIVSTGKILAKGIPHMAGRLIYEYIEDCRHEAGVNKLKFVFVGITDNINCCTARDVFCLDDRVGGVYVGDFKRPFTAIDNAHMFAVLPPTSSRYYDHVLHATEPGYHVTHPGEGGAAMNRSSIVSAHGTRKGLPPLAQRAATPQLRGGSASRRR